MKLNMICEGGYISNDNFNSVVSAAGGNSLITLANAQASPLEGLLPIISSVGGRNLSMQVDGTKASESQALQIINAILGANTSISVSSIASMTAQAVESIVRAGVGKQLSIGIDCSVSSQDGVVHAISSAVSSGVPFSVGSLNALTTEGVSAVFQVAQGNAFTASLDGRTTSGSKLQEIINAANGSAVSLSLVNSSYVPISDLFNAFSLIGDRALGMSFDATLITAQNLKDLVSSAPASVGIGIDSAQGIVVSSLVEIIQASGGKRLAVNLGADQATNDQMQSSVDSGGSSTSISISSAHIPQLNVMLEMIASSAHTNLSPIYNGSQLIVTPTDGNWVVRALEVAQPSTQIIVNSVGVTNFTLSIVLDILNAAG